MIIQKSFYFLRHGETDHNRNRLCAGSQTDVPLNKTGKEQARLVKEKIREIPVQKVICSPMKRTIQTAKLATSHPLTLEHDIRECDLGDFEGKPVPDFIKHVEETCPRIPFPNGESRHDVALRSATAVNRFLVSHGEGVLFVSHGLVYWALLEVLRIPFHYIENAGLVQFKPQDDIWGAVKI